MSEETRLSVHQEAIEERRRQIDEDETERTSQAWAELIPAMQAERAKGRHPGSAQVQELLTRWQTLVDMFTGGDPFVASTLRRKYESQGPHIEFWPIGTAQEASPRMESAASQMKNVFAQFTKDELISLLAYVEEAKAFRR
jgi:hypothetical protein